MLGAFFISGTRIPAIERAVTSLLILKWRLFLFPEATAIADDYRTYLEIELTKGKREVTEDDEREADALCKQYLERWKEEQK